MLIEALAIVEEIGSKPAAQSALEVCAGLAALAADWETSACLFGAADIEPVATAMVVVLTYWLSFEYVRDPRRALEPESAGRALSRGAYHVLCLLMPYLDAASQEHLHMLAGEYVSAS